MRKPAPHFSCRNTYAISALALILSTSITAAPPSAFAQNRTDPATKQQSIDISIADAARRFGIPQHWIRAVMDVESAGNPRAVSHAGAMGLMQIMPATWAELRAAHRLGTDPFNPRDNILAGAAYLRQMHDRFGSPGFLAAYNAGPARYQEYLKTGRALPRETRNYLAVLAPLIGDRTDEARAFNRPERAQDWRDAPLFAASAEEAQRRDGDVGPIDSEGPPSSIFVPSRREQTQ